MLLARSGDPFLRKRRRDMKRPHRRPRCNFTCISDCYLVHPAMLLLHSALLMAASVATQSCHALLGRQANEAIVPMRILITAWLMQADYRVVMTEYEKDHPKPPRRQKRTRDPSELKRPQSAYFFFLADFRELYKVQPTSNAGMVYFNVSHIFASLLACYAQVNVQHQVNHISCLHV